MISILWLPDAKSWLIGKDPDAGKDWAQEEKGTTEDEMVGWHGFGWTLGVGDGQGGLVCCGSWGHKESYLIERLNWTELIGNWTHWKYLSEEKGKWHNVCLFLNWKCDVNYSRQLNAIAFLNFCILKRYITREINTKTNHYTTIRMTDILKNDDTKCWWGCKATGMLIH